MVEQISCQRGLLTNYVMLIEALCRMQVNTLIFLLLNL